MPRSITPDELHRSGASFVVLDIRKEPAYLASGETMPGASRRLPFDAEGWWPEYAGKSVVVFCVHGREVSQAVCGFLIDKGVDARFLQGGFEGWKEAGYPVRAIGKPQ